MYRINYQLIDIMLVVLTRKKYRSIWLRQVTLSIRAGYT